MLTTGEGETIIMATVGVIVPFCNMYCDKTLNNPCGSPSRNHTLLCGVWTVTKLEVIYATSHLRKPFSATQCLALSMSHFRDTLSPSQTSIPPNHLKEDSKWLPVATNQHAKVAKTSDSLGSLQNYHSVEMITAGRSESN